MQNRGKSPEETRGFRPPLPAFLSFFQNNVLLNSQGDRVIIELTPEAKERYEVECENINSDSDCACE